MVVLGDKIYPLYLTERQLFKVIDSLEDILFGGIDQELQLILLKAQSLYEKIGGAEQ